jgi:hypothetical protein
VLTKHLSIDDYGKYVYDDDREWADINGMPYEPPKGRYYNDPVLEVLYGEEEE